MRRNRIQAIVVFLVMSLGIGAALSAAEPVTGLWISVADDGKTYESIVILYDYKGKVYGRLLATFKPDGKTVDETPLNPKDKATKLKGDPYFVGIDYVYGMGEAGKEWKGLIMDPREGEEYDCVMWKEGGKLIVRGQLKGLLGFLGRNQTWLPYKEGLLPPDVVVPDPTTFVPKIPQKK